MLNPAPGWRYSATQWAAADTQVRSAGALSFWLFAYVALLPYQWEPVQHLRFGLADVCLFLGLVFGVARIRVRREAWGVWLLALVLVFTVGLFVSAASTGSLSTYVFLNKGVGLLILLAAYLMITTEVTEWRHVRSILRVFVIGVSLQNVLALAAMMASYLAGMKFSFVNYGNERLSGMMYDPNAYGGLLVTALVFNIVGSSGAVPITRGLGRLLCNITLVVGIGFTFSRSAWMALAASWIMYLVLRPWPALKMLAVLSTAVPVIGLFVAIGAVSPARMLDRPDTIDDRLRLIDHSVAQFEKHPVVGMGLGMFRETEGLIVHNTPLWFLVDFGLTGLGVFLGFLGWSFLSGMKTCPATPPEAKPYVHAILAANAGMLGLSMGIEAFYQRHWWLCFALIAACQVAAKRAPARQTGGQESEAPPKPNGPTSAWRPGVAVAGRVRS